ncbi:hypothetical protein [Marinimicrobium sp. ABcell2]|uniref:hypothetical protein n=1 Tax=Marinimicrobium sp. ABcell2 TaxID=3069751 RepID=UPI0027B0B62C|nr:hypothetical protein [Marinimicrobium sp. ABcell2]MDQ2076191.1 hypothetical protein [Marinimicrobium sp. ABcell2]
MLLSSASASAGQYVDIGILLGTEYTDNANRSHEDGISERQDRYGITVASDYENQLLDLDVSYNAQERRFSEGSQPTRSFLEGDFNLRVGKPHHAADLLLSHSRRSALRAPDQIDLLVNRDERDIYSAIPTVRARVSSVDYLMLQGHYSMISYRFDEQRDSERLGASLIWQHDFSATDQMQITATQTEVSFDLAPDFDYTYQAVLAAYSVRLQRLAYTLEVGYNETTPEMGDTFSGPTFRVEASYDTGLHRFSVNARQFITDSSQAGGNLGDPSSFGAGRDTVGELDQLERRTADVRWDYLALCQRCDLHVNAFYRYDDYQTLGEDTDEVGLGSGLGYRFSNRASTRLTLNVRRQSFEAEADREAFTVGRARLSYQYSFVNDLSLELFTHFEKRDSNAEQRYDEARVGLTLGLAF